MKEANENFFKSPYQPIWAFEFYFHLYCMLDYFRLNKRTIWGWLISFLIFFILSMILNKTKYDSTSETLFTNLLFTLGFSLIGFILLFLESYIFFQKKTKLFEANPFLGLFEHGYKTELTSKNSIFFFVNKRLSAFTNGFPIRIEYDIQNGHVVIAIGIYTNHSKKFIKEQKNKLEILGISITDYYGFAKVMRLKEIKALKENQSLINLIQEITDRLKNNNYKPLEIQRN